MGGVTDLRALAAGKEGCLSSPVRLGHRERTSAVTLHDENQQGRVVPVRKAAVGSVLHTMADAYKRPTIPP